MANPSEKIAKLEKLQQEAMVLTQKLNSSMKIEEIWPTAFKHGSVKFKGTQRYSRYVLSPGLNFTSAWFEDETERKFYLTKEQLLEFKPDAQIHRDYSVPENKHVD